MSVIAVMTALCDARGGSVVANSRGNHITVQSGSFYDSDYADRAILVQQEVSEPYLDLKANYDDFWLHFDMYIDTMGSTGNYIEFRSQSGSLQLVVNVTSSENFEFQKSTNGTSGAGSLSGTSFSISLATIHTFDVHVILGPSGEIKLYKDGSLEFTYSGDLSTNGDEAVRFVTWKAVTPRTDNAYISQIVADTGSTVGFKVFSTYPVNTDTFTDWSGQFIGKNNTTFNGEAAGTFSNNVGDKVSWTGTSLPVAASGMAVRAVVNSARAYVTPGATPQSISPGVRFSTTNFEGVTFALYAEEGVEYCQSIFNVNPDTGVSWTYADANSAAFTYIAKA